MKTVNLSPQVLAQEELFYFVRYVFVIESVNKLNFPQYLNKHLTIMQVVSVRNTIYNLNIFYFTSSNFCCLRVSVFSFIVWLPVPDTPFFSVF